MRHKRRIAVYGNGTALAERNGMVREVNPDETKRAEAFRLWMNAPNPMVTVFKTIDVTNALRYSKRKGYKFNMVMCRCIGKAASDIEEFFLLPVGGKLMKYDSIAVNTIVKNKTGEVSSCDIEYCGDFDKFNSDYLYYTGKVRNTCENHDLTECMVIGTSALSEYDIDGVVGMYSGIYNNPFVFWGRYSKGFFKTTLKVSFQFHHTQMDGAHAGKFLELLQNNINELK